MDLRSDDHDFAPVRDTRWIDFPIKNLEFLHLRLEQLYISLSACVSKSNLQFVVSLRRLSTMSNTIIPFDFSVPKRPSESCSWVHFTIWRKDRTLYLTYLTPNLNQVAMNHNVEKKSWMRFKKFPDIKVKLHSYNFLWSNTSAAEPSVFKIEPSTNQQLCVNFYVSIDEGCRLNIVLEIDGKTPINRTIEGFNKRGSLKTWILVKLGPYYGRKGLVSLYRKNLKYTPGYWAIDQVRYCKNYAIYTASTDHFETAFCRTFGIEAEITPTKCPAGFFGNKCNISCEEVLGKNSNYCQGYEICGTTKESCSWRCKGNSCEVCGQNCTSDSFSSTFSNITDAKISTHPSTTSTSTQRTFPIKKEELFTKRMQNDVDPSQDINSPLSIKSSKQSSQPITPSLQSQIPFEQNRTDNQSEESLIDKRIILLFILIAVTSNVIVIVVIALGIICFRWLSNRNANEMSELGDTKVAKTDFDNYVKNTSKKGHLINQYKTLSNNSEKHCNVALNSANLKKIYDNCNVPYDDNRIVLEPMEDIGTSEYINASYLDGWGRRKAYIVTQGPKATTVQDFWTMVWQRDIRIIMMATNFREKMERKCFEYFPTYRNAVLPIADFGIKLVKEESFEFYKKRIIEIYYRRHHKYNTLLNWNPDQEKPLYPNYLVPLVRIMNMNYDTYDWNSIVVHCSLGVGLSAILILCDLALQMAKTEGYVDVHYLAKMLREQRPNMIASSEDYTLAHLVISECFMDEFGTSSSTIQQQLEYLNTCTWHDSILHNQNSLLVEGYQGEVTYLHLKQPQHDSSLHFWETVILNKIKVIVFLNDNHIKLWPCKLRLSEKSICNIHELSSQRTSYCKEYRVVIEEIDVRTTTLYREEITILQLCDWRLNVEMSSVEKFLLFEQHTRMLGPLRRAILVCCSNGITGCGLFMTLSHIIRKYLKEINYDVPNAVRTVRRGSKKFVSNPEELLFVHEAVTLYSQRFDPYTKITT